MKTQDHMVMSEILNGELYQPMIVWNLTPFSTVFQLHISEASAPFHAFLEFF